MIGHIETVPPSQEERYGPDFKKMNKAAAIQWVYHQGIFLRDLSLSLSGYAVQYLCFKGTSDVLVNLTVSCESAVIIVKQMSKGLPGSDFTSISNTSTPL